MATKPLRHQRIDFDAWRNNYDRLTYAEHVEFYRQVAEVYPDQQHYNESAIREFLAGSSGPVLELGGWKGELAASVLPDFPGIPEWLNVEIAPQTIDTVCHDPRYLVVVPEAFIWDWDFDLTPYRTFIASHVIEHMKRADVARLLSRLNAIERMYVDAPLPRKPSLWGGGESSHIIELGWDKLGALIMSYGFSKVGESEGKWGPAYWFER